MTSDINQVQNGVNLTLRLLLRSPFIVIGALIMAYTISSRLTLLFIAAYGRYFADYLSHYARHGAHLS